MPQPAATNLGHARTPWPVGVCCDALACYSHSLHTFRLPFGTPLSPPPLCCFVKTFACISIYVHGIKFSAPSKWVTRNGTDCAANKHKLSLFPLLLLFVIFTRAPKRMHAIFSFVAQSPSPFCTCPSDCMCVYLCTLVCVCRELRFVCIQHLYVVFSRCSI